jgi:hypothetical protein
LFKIRRIFAAVLFVFILSSSAWALEPQNALSSQPEESCYVTLRVNNLGGILKDILSPANVELFASLFPRPADVQGFRIFSGYASQLPARSVAILAGVTLPGDVAVWDEEPTFQIAISMPKELQPKLSLVAEGKATAEDLIVLFLGDVPPFLPPMPDIVVRQGKQGSYYAMEGVPAFALSAKEDLLLFSPSPEGLDASKEALEKADKRLAFKRRFESRDYFAFHMDVPTLIKMVEKTRTADKSTEALLKFFKEPLNFEMAFDSKPGSFLVSSAINAESMINAERLKKLKAPKGGGLFFAGEGKSYFGLGGQLNVEQEDWALFPELAKAMDTLLKELEKEGISRDDVQSLLKGTVSLTVGGHAKFLGVLGQSAPGVSLPGVSFAITGQNGATGRILKKLFLENEKFTSSVPLAPLKADGWDMLFQVNPGLLPVSSVLVGLKGETLFLGLLDPDEINKKPTFSPQIAELVAQDSFATAFLDVPELWGYLKRLFAESAQFLNKDANYPIVMDIMEGEPPVGLIKVWAPSFDTSFMEFQIIDVAQEKSLLPRLVNALRTVLIGSDADDSGDDDFDVDASQPLVLLMVAKGAVEERLDEDPDADLDDLREDLSDFAVILKTENGIYVGTQVTGEEKTILREQAEQFGVLGSAGLTLAPNGTPYSDQEAAWLQVDLPQ